MGVARHFLTRCAGYENATRKQVAGCAAGRLSPPSYPLNAPLRGPLVPLKQGGLRCRALAGGFELQTTRVEDGFGIARRLLTALEHQVTGRLKRDRPIEIGRHRLIEWVVRILAIHNHRRGRILKRLAAATDHVTDFGFGEGAYLKGLAIEIE